MKRLYTTLFFFAIITFSITGHAQRIMISIAGNGRTTSSGDGLPANQASISRPVYLTIDPTGNLYLVDGNKIRMVNTSGVITTIAGGGSSTAEGIPATNASLSPTYICTNSAGDLFVVTNNKIRKIGASSHSITTYAGTGSSGYSGDGGPASAAAFNGIKGICSDGSTMYIVDANNSRIRKVQLSTGIVTAFAGTGTAGYSGDGSPATSAMISNPTYVCCSSSGDVYFSDQTYQYIRKVSASTGIVSTYAGGGSTFVNCLRSNVNLSGLSGILVSTGNRFCFNESSCSARQINPSNDSVTYLGGNRSAGGFRDDTNALCAMMDYNYGLASDAYDNIYTTDGYGMRIRKMIKLTNTPTFAFGKTQAINPCPGYSYPLNKQLSITDLDSGQTETWTVISSPSVGTLSGFPATTISNGIHTTVKAISTFYAAPSSYTGNDSFKIRVSDGVLADTVVVHVSVQNASAGTITGSSTLCEGANTNMTAAAGVGTWSTSNALATINPTTGLLTGISAGVDTVIYTLSAPCPVTAILPVTINRTPVAGTITGADTVCRGATTTFTASVSGGTWSSTISSYASVNASSGLVRGVQYSSSTPNIKYTVTLGTCTATATKPIFVNAPVSSLSSTLSVCLGSSSSLIEYVTGGTWSVSNSRAVASVTASSSYTRAILTGVSTGLDTIYYVNTNSCGTDTAMSVITVYDTVAPTITGPSDVCVGSTITLTSSMSGGYWYSYSSTGSIGTTTGVLTGRSPGRDSIVYRISGSSCVPAVSRIIMVSIAPHGGTITGPTSVCTGSSVTLADTTTGGTWSVTNTNATITSSGLLTGVTAGLDTVVYTVTNACGTASTSRVETITTGTTSAGTITGPGSVCTGSSITLADATTGGTWSVTNANATISSTGVVSGVSYGYDTVVYTVTGGCGTATATRSIYINTVPIVGSITGPTTVCTGAVIALLNSETGGTWNASNANAAFSSYGILSGVTVGYDTITYSLSNACGSAVATSVINVITTPNPGTITGPATVCIGSTITMADAVSGGIWSTANPRAWISTSGVVTGITTGIDTVIYAVANTCGTSYAKSAITITDCHSTGIPEPGINPAINIFPNPATSVLNIEWPAGAADVEIRVTDATGRTVVTESITDKNIRSRKLDLTLLADGIYLVKVKAGGSYSTAKVVLSR